MGVSHDLPFGRAQANPTAAPNPLLVEPRTRDRQRALLAAILLASFLLYAPSLANDFTWDDRHAAMGSGPTKNPLVAKLHPISAYFANNWWPQHAPMATAYRPLTTLWFAVRHALVGDHAMVAHLANVLLHTLAVFGSHLLLRGLGLPFFAAASGAAVFGLHAVHSEAVANLVGGAELLALDCGLGGTLLLFAAVKCTTGFGFVWRLTGAALLWCAAAASKENGLGWVVFAPLCAWVRAQGGASQMTRRRWCAVALASAGSALVYWWLRHGMLARLPGGRDGTVGLLENPLLELDAPLRAASGILAWGYGVVLTLAPFRLTVDYGPAQLPIVRSVGSAWFWASLALTMAMGSGLFAAWRAPHHRPRVALALACFVVFSLPLSNVAMPVFMHFAERNYTTPSLALAIVVAAIAARLRGTVARRVGRLVLAAWLLASLGAAVPRNFVWADDDTLVAREVVHSPSSVRLHLCAGRLALHRREPQVARDHFATAAALADHLPQPWLELGTLELALGNLDQAQRAAGRAAAGHAREVARYAEPIARLREAIARAAAAAPAAAPR